MCKVGSTYRFAKAELAKSYGEWTVTKIDHGCIYATGTSAFFSSGKEIVLMYVSSLPSYPVIEVSAAAPEEYEAWFV